MRFAASGDCLTGLLLQRMPSPDDAVEMVVDADDTLWETVSRATTTLPAEILAEASPAAALRRAYRAFTINLQPPRALEFHCTCSRERSTAMLAGMPREDMLELLTEQGSIEVTCEVCGERYVYDAVDVHTLLPRPGQQLH